MKVKFGELHKNKMAGNIHKLVPLSNLNKNIGGEMAHQAHCHNEQYTTKSGQYMLSMDLPHQHQMKSQVNPHPNLFSILEYSHIKHTPRPLGTHAEMQCT